MMFLRFSILSLYIILILLELKSLVCAVEYSDVFTSYGPIRGVATDAGTEKIYTYWGVPYAKPPTGNRRFRPPEPPDSWSMTRDALIPSSDCMQSLWFGLDKLGVQLNISEDYLYLNIFTPSQTTNTTLLPVMVWIYGGGFIMGSARPYDGTALARKGVVVVTLNYRLDAFGFLSTEDNIIPGNFGLLDQISAWKWVKENIANFGGDSNQVTLFGESAGACSVSILSISPLAKGLFKRFIMESGSTLSQWCVKYPLAHFKHRQIADTLGSKVNCSINISDQYLICLQSINPHQLLQASFEVQKETHVDMTLVPRVEQTFGVLPDLPRKLLEGGSLQHVDVILGFNSNEAGAIKENFTLGATYDEVKSNILPTYLGYMNWPDQDAIVKQITDLYFQNISDPIQTLHRASDFISDFYFVLPAILEAGYLSAMSGAQKQYLYEFSYRKSDSFLPPWASSDHADELYFVFGDHYQPVVGTNRMSPEDLAVADQVMTLWTNFAKTGNPTSSITAGAAQWPVFNATDPRLLKINRVSSVTSPGRQQAFDLYKKLLAIMEDRNVDVVVGKRKVL